MFIDRLHYQYSCLNISHHQPSLNSHTSFHRKITFYTTKEESRFYRFVNILYNKMRLNLFLVFIMGNWFRYTFGVYNFCNYIYLLKGCKNNFLFILFLWLSKSMKQKPISAIGNRELSIRHRKFCSETSRTM